MLRRRANKSEWKHKHKRKVTCGGVEAFTSCHTAVAAIKIPRVRDAATNEQTKATPESRIANVGGRKGTTIWHPPSLPEDGRCRRRRRGGGVRLRQDHHPVGQRRLGHHQARGRRRLQPPAPHHALELPHGQDDGGAPRVGEVGRRHPRVPQERATRRARPLRHPDGVGVRVVSDANSFFIETILEHHGVLGCFSEINTNPARVDAQGRLRISPFHDPTTSPHLCPDNMCKGKIIQRIQGTDSAKNKHFIYIGDGKGDYCPSLKLREGDYVMPKENYPLWNLISSDPQLIKAEVHPWCSGEDFERILLKLVNKLITSHAPVSQLDYKCEMSNPVPTEVGHHQTLPVPN